MGCSRQLPDVDKARDQPPARQRPAPPGDCGLRHPAAAAAAAGSHNTAARLPQEAAWRTKAARFPLPTRPGAMSAVCPLLIPVAASAASRDCGHWPGSSSRRPPQPWQQEDEAELLRFSSGCSACEESAAGRMAADEHSPAAASGSCSCGGCSSQLCSTATGRSSNDSTQQRRWPSRAFSIRPAASQRLSSSAASVVSRQPRLLPPPLPLPACNQSRLLPRPSFPHPLSLRRRQHRRRLSCSSATLRCCGRPAWSRRS